MLLLLLHLAQDGLLLDLDQRLALVLAQRQPELADALALLLGGCVPYGVLAGPVGPRVRVRVRVRMRVGVRVRVRVCRRGAVSRGVLGVGQRGRRLGGSLFPLRLLRTARGYWVVAVRRLVVVPVGAVCVPLVVLDLLVRVELGVVVVLRVVQVVVVVVLVLEVAAAAGAAEAVVAPPATRPMATRTAPATPMEERMDEVIGLLDAARSYP